MDRINSALKAFKAAKEELAAAIEEEFPVGCEVNCKTNLMKQPDVRTVVSHSGAWSSFPAELRVSAANQRWRSQPITVGSNFIVRVKDGTEEAKP